VSIDGVHLAQVKTADIIIEDHDTLVYAIDCEYDMGSHQAFCPIFHYMETHQNGGYLKELISRFNYRSVSAFLAKLPGSIVKVKVIDGMIRDIGPWNYMFPSTSDDSKA
jgi:hypothetical protein